MRFISKLKKNHAKWLNSELVFYVAMFCLPFENFFFAPSEGWAAITPIILALYIILNIKLFPKTFLKLRKIFYFFITAVIIGSFTAFLINVNLKDYINAFVPLGLGAISLLSFFIFYEKKKDISKVINLVVIAYSICAVIGVFEWLALETNNVSFSNWLAGIFKRNYLTTNSRVQFFFTEPSFIGMHLFGILLPLYWLSRRKDLLFIIGLFCIEAIAFNSGVRVIIDIVVIAMIYFIYLLIVHKRAKFIPLIILTLCLGFSYFYNNNNRFNKIVNNGIYADGSLASRYFRIQASVIGYTKKPGQALVGYGLGNSIKPLHDGYEEARETYDSAYTREVDALDNKSTVFHDDSVSYSLYIRMISEFGLIMTIIAIIYLIKITKNSCLPQRWLYLTVILYIYIQFESLGFYALWLFIATMLFTSKNEMTEKTLIKRIADNVFRKAKNGK